MFGINSALQLMTRRHLVSLSDALKLRRNSQEEMQIFLRPAKHNIALRGGSTDVYCFEKVFLYEEYLNSF